MQILANNIRGFRKFKGYTQIKFASILGDGITPGMVSTYENGTALPNLIVVSKFLQITNRTFEEVTTQLIDWELPTLPTKPAPDHVNDFDADQPITYTAQGEGSEINKIKNRLFALESQFSKFGSLVGNLDEDGAQKLKLLEVLVGITKQLEAGMSEESYRDDKAAWLARLAGVLAGK